jgi:chromosome segregation ATPase
MKTQIDTLKRDIQIHKEVEKELAKRSHFCQKVIKRLKQQVKDLQTEKTENTGRPTIMGGVGSGGTQRGGPKANGKYETSSLAANNKANEDLINFLEHKLEEIEKKLQRTQSEYELLQTDYVDLQDKMNMSREKYKRAALLMTEFLDDILN